jgi:hypothetical protein
VVSSVPPGVTVSVTPGGTTKFTFLIDIHPIMLVKRKSIDSRMWGPVLGCQNKSRRWFQPMSQIAKVVWLGHRNELLYTQTLFSKREKNMACDSGGTFHPIII